MSTDRKCPECNDDEEAKETMHSWGPPDDPYDYVTFRCGFCGNEWTVRE